MINIMKEFVDCCTLLQTVEPSWTKTRERERGRETDDMCLSEKATVQEKLWSTQFISTDCCCLSVVKHVFA